ncbi:hypothetical protein [Nitrospina watsonii]|uniref:Uncharacterized protein n=1 Tax=Nitrospina watsonii TaxID=1323948 RepID=A0ABM9HG04_9BACT|nr:hypothetical protein [Nitrospina watsonii]CAI2718988.1 conserved protein of unknown function [Nitrospina watsonii]
MSETPGQNNADKRYILQFKAATGFTVVLEYGGQAEMEKDQQRIEEAGLTCEHLSEFTTQFHQADLYMDMRSPECQVQFDLDDWI